VFQKFKSLFGAQDMTVGKPLGVMMRFAIPLLFGNIAQLMYNIVDSMVVGRMINSNALAAVGASAPIQQLFFVFFMAVGTGVSVMVAQYFGAKDKERLSQTIGGAMTLTFIVTAFVTVIGIIFTSPILRLTNVTDPEMFRFAKDYLFWTFVGTIGQGYYNILSGILRGMGESIFPLFVLIGTAILNVLLDIWMVATPEQLSFGPIVGLNWGVAGAAIATTVCQYLSAFVCFIRLRQLNEYAVINRDTLRPRKIIVLQIVRIGIPSGIQQAVLSMSSLLVQSLINSIAIIDAAGMVSYTIFAACNVAVSKVDNIAMLPNQAFSMAGSTFAGQNIGAGKMDRVRKGFNIILLTSLAVSAVLIVVISIWGGNLMELFIDVNRDPNASIIIKYGVQMQRIMVWCYIAMSFTQASSGVLRGAGDTFPVMIITIIGTVGMRMPMAYLMVHLSKKTAEFPAGNPSGVYWSMLICFSLVAGACALYYKMGKWKDKVLVRHNTKEPITDGE
jgi:putative MATE family efflux protein